MEAEGLPRPGVANTLDVPYKAYHGSRWPCSARVANKDSEEPKAISPGGESTLGESVTETPASEEAPMLLGEGRVSEMTRGSLRFLVVVIAEPPRPWEARLPRDWLGLSSVGP